jgi:hypothetical protein
MRVIVQAFHLGFPCELVGDGNVKSVLEESDLVVATDEDALVDMDECFRGIGSGLSLAATARLSHPGLGIERGDRLSFVFTSMISGELTTESNTILPWLCKGLSLHSVALREEGDSIVSPH